MNKDSPYLVTYVINHPDGIQDRYLADTAHLPSPGDRIVFGESKYLVVIEIKYSLQTTKGNGALSTPIIICEPATAD